MPAYANALIGFGEIVAGYGYVDAWGEVLPPNGSLGFAHGCVFRLLTGTGAGDAIYKNAGTSASSNFVADTAISNASELAFTAAVVAHWNGAVDPGAVDDALDQLAERVNDLEGAGGGDDIGAQILAKSGGYWKFDELTGVRKDLSANQLAFTENTTAIEGVAGHVGIAASFDGVANHLLYRAHTTQISGAEYPFESEPMTALDLMFWVNVDDITDPNELIYMAGGAASGFQIDTDNALVFRFGNDSASVFATCPGLTSGNWHHVAISYSGSLTGSANRLKMWIDGVARTLSFTGTVPAEITIGGQAILLGRGTYLMQQFAYAREAFDADERAWHYNDGDGNSPATTSTVTSLEELLLGIVRVSVDDTTEIAVGDLLYLDTDDAKPASSQEDQGSEPNNQSVFVSKFLGVAMDAHANGSGTALIRVQTAGRVTLAASLNTWELGELVGPRETGGTTLLNQSVTKVSATDKAIGRCVQRAATSTNSVTFDIVSTIIKGGSMPPS